MSDRLTGAELRNLDAPPVFGPPREYVAGSRKWIKHVHCNGARFHVLSYSTQGAECSEPDCVVNRRQRDARRVLGREG